MRLEAGKNIGKHTDKIDKDIGFDDGDIIRIHMIQFVLMMMLFLLYMKIREIKTAQNII